MANPVSTCFPSAPRFGARSFIMLLTVMITIAFSGPLHADMIRANLDPKKFGNLDQDNVPIIGACACGPTAAVNSFVYLQNMFPQIYNKSLVPDTNKDGMLSQPEMAAVATILGGAAYMDTRPDIGGTYIEDFIFGKRKYLEEKVPGKTVYEAQISIKWGRPRAPKPEPSNGIPKPGFVQDMTPARLGFIAQELKDGEDVEVFVEGPRGSHYLTITGIIYDDTTNIGTTSFIDPATGMAGMAKILGLMGGIIQTDYQLGGNTSLFHAVSESPVPEPSTVILFAIGLVGLAGYGWWRRRTA